MAIAVSFYRGKGLFDIDFTGGVSVQACSTSRRTSADVREKLSELPDLAITKRQGVGVQRGKWKASVSTSTRPSEDKGKVAQVLNAKLPDMLETNSLDSSRSRR